MMKAKGRAPIIIAIYKTLNGFFAAPELLAISSAPIKAVKITRHITRCSIPRPAPDKADIIDMPIITIKAATYSTVQGLGASAVPPH
jgi:hypothetical protein